MARTSIVMGNYRGGTTATIAALKAGGLFVGTANKLPETLEDPAFVECLHPVDAPPRITKLGKLIERRNANFRQWGFKYPGTWAHIESVVHLFRDPHCIFVFRDPYAVGLSELKHEDLNPLECTQTAARRSLQMVETGTRLLEKGYPVMFVSYEKLVLNKHEEVSRLLEFAGIPAKAWEQRFIDAVDAVNVKRGYGVNI